MPCCYRGIRGEGTGVGGWGAGSGGPDPWFPVPLPSVNTDFEAEALELADEHVEALGHVGLGDVVALDDGFVGLRAALDVVTLHREQFAEDARGAVGVERPHLHLAEALAAELRLPAQRLLGDERVRP